MALDIQDNMQEMLEQAAKSGSYKWLEQKLKEVKKQLADNPTQEMRDFAKKWTDALKSKKEELLKAKNETCSDTASSLVNLREELELSQEIQDRLEELAIIKELKENSSLDFEDVNMISALKCIAKSDFKWWNSRAWFDAKYTPSWRGINMWFTELKNLNAFKKEYDTNDWFKTLVNKTISKYNLWEVKVVENSIKQQVKDTPAITTIDNKKQDKKSKIREDGVNLYEENKTWEELQLPKEESKAIEQILWIKLDKVNYKSLFALKEYLKITAPLETKDGLKNLWYKPTGMGWMISDSEFAQAKWLQEALRDTSKYESVNWVLYYYDNWNTAIDYLRDKQISEKVKSDNVYDALSYKDIGSAKWVQLREVFRKSKNETKTVQAVMKLINAWRNESISGITSKLDLYNLIKKDPSTLLSFRKWTDRVWYASVDLWRYIDNWWDISEDLAALERGTKKLDIALDDNFEKKFPDAIAKAKENINNSTTLAPEEKAKQLAMLDDLQTKNKQWFKDFFKIKSLWFLASFVESKKWGWWAMIIWNNSENSIISKIDIEIWLFATADNKLYPGIWLAISDKYDFTDTIQWNARAWVNFYWVYILAGIDKQINAEDLSKASFKDFDGKTKRVWIYGNAWIGWVWWASYWVWLYYKESAKEGIEKKAKQLESVIEKFKDIKTLSEIDNVDLWEIKWDDAKLLKFEVKRLLESLWFDKPDNTQERKNQIIELVKRSKLNEFYQVASATAEDKWWNWSWVALWVQFIWGFFPIPVFGVSFSKSTQEQKANTHKQKTDALIQSWKNWESKDSTFIVEEIKNTLDLDISFDKEKWVFVINWYDDTKWMIINKIGQWVKVLFNKETAKNLKIDWDKLVIWKVGPIRSLANNTAEGILLTLKLWWWKEELKPGSASSFSTDIEEGLITTQSVKTQDKLWWVNIEKKLESYSDFIEKNKETITRWLSIYKSAKWNAYINIRKWLDSGNLEQARKGLINYLEAHNKKDSKGAVDYIKSLKNENELASTIADFKDILMSDQSTIKVSWVTQEEKNRMTEEFKKNPTKYKNVNTYDLLTKDFNWDKTLNRKRAFTRIVNKNLWSNSVSVLEMRERAENDSKWETGWTSEKRNNIFALVWSYKIAKDSEWKTHSAWSWFDAMPPWVVSVANGRTYEFAPANKRELIEQFANKKVYFDNMKNSILSSLNAKLPEWNKINKDSFTREKFIQILETGSAEIDGKKVNIESKFIFFLYWRCFNESVGIEFWNMSVEQDGKQTVTTPIDFASQKNMDQTVIRPDEVIASVWVWFPGHKKQDQQAWNPNNNTTTPGATQWSWNSNVADSSGSNF